jgi:hypothetical protein
MAENGQKRPIAILNISKKTTKLAAFELQAGVIVDGEPVPHHAEYQ